MVGSHLSFNFTKNSCNS